MAGPDRRSSSGIDRRASARVSIEDQFDDDYDLEAMGISDGFRPSNTVGYNGAMSQQRGNPERREPVSRLRPSSISKPNRTDNFALRHDGGIGADSTSDSQSASGSSSMPTRASSVSTDMGYMRPESPYRGPTGPSHPYQMYPQESRLARTASMATTSTAPITERSYAGPSGPTHPYGMYPQNIVAESEAGDPPPPSPPAPVGFPGLNNNYQRRLGPDGEEAAGIIGPDGHTEELPPYTQYPDEAFARKTRPNVTLTVPNGSSSSPAMAMASGAGGIGLATRNPEFASREDLNSPQSRGSIMSDLSGHNVNTAAADAAVGNEKPQLKRWQKAARRKVCGIIPVWVFGIIAISFIFFGIILATVLAILKPKHSRNYNNNLNGGPPIEIQGPASTLPPSIMTTTYDATPLTSVPTGMPDLPTGDFIIPISAPQLSQNTCLENTEQSNAWSCSIPMVGGPLQMNLTPLAGSPDPLSNIEMTLDYGNDDAASFTYGAQPPQFDEQQVLRLVTDVDETSRGPAWWFQMPYNKLVILRNTELTTPQFKREEHGVGEFGGRKGTVQTNDVAWFCYWNGTVLEAFIYPNQTTAYGSKLSAVTTTASSPPRSSSTYGAAMPTGQTSGSPYGSYQYGILPYSRVVKIEEHRVSQGPNVIPPYCTLTQVTAEGPQAVLNTTGQPVMVYLNETESSNFSRRSVNLDLESEIQKRTISLTKREPGSEKTCGCVWLYQ